MLALFVKSCSNHSPKYTIMNILLPALFLGGSTSIIQSENGGRYAFDHARKAVGLLLLREICWEVLKHNPNGVIPFFNPEKKDETRNLVCEMNIEVPQAIWRPHSDAHPGVPIVVMQPRQVLIAERLDDKYFQLAFLSHAQLLGDEWFTCVIEAVA